MGRHKEWRAVAKKERRRRIRTLKAKQRDKLMSPSSTDYENWLQEQEALELFEYEQIEKTNKEANRKWIEAEKNAISRWQALQEKIKIAHQQKLEKEARIRQERLEEQKKIEEEKLKLKEIEEQKKKQQQIFMEKMQQFLSGDSTEPPEELMVSRETKPNTESCPFFSKTACCRFGDQCSRNHIYPGISKVLLAENFYLHFGLDNSQYNEYDTDVMLEYEDNDTYIDFKEFFYDVVPEFEKFGQIVQFKVCKNFEKHLRGNTYVEFTELRSAVAAYRALHCRWYGGRQLSLQFCLIDSWRNAICGLQSSKRCPKGRACNFLHVFKNPDNLFNSFASTRDAQSRTRTPLRCWRWSESPEVEISRRNSPRSERHRSERKHSHHSEKEDRYHRHRSRRRSSERRSRYK